MNTITFLLKTYAAEFVSFELFGFPATETPLINKVRQIVRHELINFGNCSLESILALTGNVEIEGWSLGSHQHINLRQSNQESYRRGGHVLVGVVFASRGDILTVISALS